MKIQETQPADLSPIKNMTAATSVSHPKWGTLMVRPGETVLDACLRLGVKTPFSCRGGSCHTCMLRCTGGELPERAQKGLGAKQLARGLFLPCVCTPSSPLRIDSLQPQDSVTECRIEGFRNPPEAGGSQPGQPRTDTVCVLEPMSSLPPLELGASLNIYLTEPLENTAPPSDTWHGTAIALPETHYYLEASLKPPTEPTDFAKWVGETVWVCPSAEPTTAAAAPESSASHHRHRVPPDPALWAELDQGKRVRQILDAFYERVFTDEQLAPYFQATTRAHSAGKQYAFLYEAITGEDQYFGDNPRNAHHHMVISDALFDHRQQLMLETLQAHGLSDDQIRRWTAFEEPFRPDIVKQKPFPRMVEGRPQPMLDGFGIETLTVGAICDHCGAIIEPNTPVLYHLRLGTLSCPACGPTTGPNP